MMKVLDMRTIRYSNIFYKVTKIRCKHCFDYNNSIVFAIPKKFVLKAIGRENSNLEKLNRIIGRKIRIIAIPDGREDLESFVATLTKPVKFKGLEIKGDEVVITATTQSKASLIGKNKVRLNEMQDILGQYFGIKKVWIK